jgi:branched-chain amino acid transport system permease protein
MMSRIFAGANRWLGVVGVIAVAIFFACPLVVGSEDVVYYFSLVAIWSLFVIGYDLAFGVTGLLSLGHAAFFGVGAYVHAILMLNFGWAFGFSLVAGGAMAGLLATIFGALTVRVSGVFFALTTQALGEMVFILASTRLSALTGGVEGLAGVPRPSLSPLDFYDPKIFYLLTVSIFGVGLFAMALIRSSAFGQVLKGIRQSEIRIGQLGFSVRNYKIGALTVSGVYAGIAGGLLASLMSFVSPQIMQWTVSGDLLIMTLLGGAGTLFGPIIGVALVEFLREELSAITIHWSGVLGLAFVLCTIFLPTGVIGVTRRFTRAMS